MQLHYAKHVHAPKLMHTDEIKYIHALSSYYVEENDQPSHGTKPLARIHTHTLHMSTMTNIHNNMHGKNTCVVSVLVSTGLSDWISTINALACMREGYSSCLVCLVYLSVPVLAAQCQFTLPTNYSH